MYSADKTANFKSDKNHGGSSMFHIVNQPIAPDHLHHSTASLLFLLPIALLKALMSTKPRNLAKSRNVE